MAQHDYDIANQSGSSFRSDLNNCLDAIQSQNSGSSEPSTTVAFMPWADTNANLIKFRNAANDGFITLCATDGTFPAKTFTGDVTLNAQSDLRLADSDSSNFVAFQAPATISTSYTLTLPAADGTSGQALVTDGSGTLSFSTAGGGDISDTAPERTFTNTTEEDTDGGRESKITFKGEQSGGEVSTLAQIEASHDGASDDEKGQIQFRTNDGNDGSSPTTRATIDSSGRMLVGTENTYVDTPTGAGGYRAKIYIAGDTNNDNGLYMSVWDSSTDYDAIGVPLVISRSKGGTVGTFGALSSGNSIGTISFNGDDGDQFVSAAAIEAAVDGTPGDNDMPGRLMFSTTADGAAVPTERMRIDSSGRLLVGTTSDISGSSTDTTLQLVGASNNRHGELYFGRNDSSANAGDTIGKIEFRCNDGGTYEPLAAISGVADGTLASGDKPGRLVFSTTADGSSSLTERMRIDSDGALMSAAGTATASTGDNHHQFHTSFNNYGMRVRTTNTSQTADAMRSENIVSAGSGWNIFRGYSGNGSSSSNSDVEFALRGDGNGYADGSWNGGGADYAEYFEWSDSNPDEEDRRGISVVLDGDKIREAVADEEPIGVISGNPSVVGDAAWNKWIGKYLRDEFGTYIQEDYEVEDEDGNTVVQQRRKLNPAYDPDLEYISREQRPEWDCVGLMGKLRIRKGQFTGSRWIKMRDISDSVEEWLVR